MKRFLLWSFERGSKQYDVICVIILAFIFLTPPSMFHDRPDPGPVSFDEVVRETRDINGTPVFIVQEVTEQAAVARLNSSRGKTFTISKTEPVYDPTGALVAYSIWIER
jgi:hypothetical protein